jgi:hypothetical protein
MRKKIDLVGAAAGGSADLDGWGLGNGDGGDGKKGATRSRSKGRDERELGNVDFEKLKKIVAEEVRLMSYGLFDVWVSWGGDVGTHWKGRKVSEKAYSLTGAR